MDKLTPRDHPYRERPHRVYVALTNHCNRECPWCSMYSSPKGATFISKEQFLSVLPLDKQFELQLEGGEPTTHPLFWEFIFEAKSLKNCSQIIVCTNGTRMPRNQKDLRHWLDQLGDKFTIKVSINHHLIERDPGIFKFAQMLCRQLPIDAIDKNLVLNIRLRQGVEYDEITIRHSIDELGLTPWANIFYLQKYGLASDKQDWAEPFTVGNNFTLVNPDAISYGTDLVARSEAMRKLR